MIELDLHLCDARQRRAGRQQASEGRMGESGRLAKNEIVGRFGLDRSDGGGTREGCNQAVRIAGAESKGGCGGDTAE